MSDRRFQYRAVDRTGSRSKGVTEAIDRRDAYRKLVAAGLRPTHVRELRSIRARGRSVSAKDLSVFSYQFSVLLEARVPIVDAIRTIGAQESNQRFADLLKDVSDRIEAGASVTDAFAPHRNVFGDVYIETLRAAEVSGNMIEVLQKLAVMLDSSHELSKSVKGALVYPACVISALGLAVLFLMMFVVPRFAKLFGDRGIDLPLPTQILVGTSGFIADYWYLLIAGGASVVMLVRRGWSVPLWRRRIDGWLHVVPIIRPILQGVAISRFAHVFGLTLRSGLSLMDALELSGRASGRPLLQMDAEKMREQVKHGGRLSDVMMRCEYLPGFAKRLFSAGEEAAELSRMNELVARHYDREVEHLARNVATVLEPVMVVGLAGVVLVIALAIFLPMWNMTAVMG